MFSEGLKGRMAELEVRVRADLEEERKRLEADKAEAKVEPKRDRGAERSQSVNTEKKGFLGGMFGFMSSDKKPDPNAKKVYKVKLENVTDGVKWDPI